jgi:hypothetical protein
MGAFVNTNDYLTGRLPVPFPAGGELVSYRATLALGTADLDQNDIGPVAILPAGCVPVDVYVDGTDMDTSTAALIFDVGVLESGGSDLSTASGNGGGKWGSTTAANTAFSQRMAHSLNAINGVTKSNSDRMIALKVATAPTTAASGTVGVTLVYRAA